MPIKPHEIIQAANAKRAREMADKIKDFDKRSLEEEYTDTDEAWELLKEARRVLLRFTKP